MKRLGLATFAGLLFLSFAFVQAEQNSLHSTFSNNDSLTSSPWKIGKDYEVRFSTQSAEGTLKGLSGNIHFDPDDLANAQFDVSVDVATIDTGNDKKDEHARSEIWFHALEFPKISFTSTDIRKIGNLFEVTGLLNMRGVGKEITFPFSFSPTENGGLFEGTFRVNREDYGLNGPWMAFTVGEEVKVTLKVPVKR
jgi:polyisoprenoid-binding protein YceI